MLAAAIDRWWRRITHGWPRTNCLFFAVALFIARRKGRITFRRARNSILPHFMYRERGRLIHYVPVSGGDSECSPLFRGWVKWGEHELPAPDPAFAESVRSLREWAREHGGPRDVFCLKTKYGMLAFFKSQIDAMRMGHQLEALLAVRIDLARADLEARAMSRIQNIN